MVRKADGAHFEAGGDNDLGNALLWASVHGGMEDLPELADEWIKEIVSTCDGAMWSYPPGILEAWAKEVGYGPDTRPIFYGSETKQAAREAERRAEKEARKAEEERWREENAEEIAERNGSVPSGRPRGRLIGWPFKS